MDLCRLNNIQTLAKRNNLVQWQKYFFSQFTKLIPNSLIVNKWAFVQIMVWHQTSDRPRYEPMMTPFQSPYMGY